LVLGAPQSLLPEYSIPRPGTLRNTEFPDKDVDTPDVLPGHHRVWVDKNDMGMVLGKLDPLPDRA